MNKLQRKEIGTIIDAIHAVLESDDLGTLSNQPEISEEGVKAYRKACTNVSNAIDGPRSQVEDLRDTEQDKYDNMPEAFQDGERGEAIQEGLDLLEEALDALESAISLVDDDGFAPDTVDELVEFLEDVVGALGNV